jgi:hypothetical protein
MMKSKHFVAISAALVLVLLISAGALAMSSPNYRLDWFVRLSGGGGGRSSSTSYVADFTVGQAAAGPSSSTGYQAGMGYWYGTGSQYAIFMPVVSKNN